MSALDNLERWLDGEPPGLGETVIHAIDAVRDYKRLLLALETDYGIRGQEQHVRRIVRLCDALIEDLDSWELNPGLRADGGWD